MFKQNYKLWIITRNTSTIFLNFPSLYEQIRILYEILTYAFQNLFGVINRDGNILREILL